MKVNPNSLTTDEELFAFYSRAYTALTLLTSIPVMSDDLESLHFYGKDLLQSKLALVRVLEMLRAEMEKRDNFLPALLPKIPSQE